MMRRSPGVSASGNRACSSRVSGGADLRAYRQFALPVSRTLSAACGLIALASASFAAKKPAGPPPAISSLFPDGGRAGSSFPCRIAGTLTKTQTHVWTDHEGIVFKPTGKTDTFDVVVAANTPPGPHLLRFFNDNGASPPRIFVVGRCDETADIEPNDDFHEPQRLPGLPVTVNGRLEKAGDVDTFEVKVGAGRRLVCDLQGYALGSPMDPALRVLDERGVEIAMSHDTHNLDPFIACEVKKAGAYLVQVMAFAHPPAADVNLKGGADHVYRLTITDRPYARAVWPPAVKRGTEGKVKPLGWNFGALMEGPETRADASRAIASDEMLRIPTANGEPVLAAVVNSAPVTEVEPNNDSVKAGRVALPSAIAGRIETPGDEDRFVFSARKGERLEFRVRSFALRSPMDAWLRIEDKRGKTLQQADDEREGAFDPVLNWRAPADGDFILAVGDLFSRGGWSFVYVVEAGPAAPRITATLDANAYRLEAGKTVDLKLSSKPGGGFKGKLIVRVEGLPEGVSAKEVELPAKGGDLKLTLSAGAGVVAANRPFSVFIATSAPDAPQTFRASFPLPVTEPRGDRLIDEDSRAWLTVVGKAAEDKPVAVTPAPPSQEKE